MGHVRFTAIVVTTLQGHAEIAIEEAKRTGCRVTPLVESVVNGYYTFMICPSGSKTGWAEKDEETDRNATFKRWLRDQRYYDGSNQYEWAEVSYGESMTSHGYDATLDDHEWK